ncbi:hypothetical protein [Citrobacter tructae]
MVYSATLTLTFAQFYCYRSRKINEYA